MHRLNVESPAGLYMLVSKRLSRKLLVARAQSVCKEIKGGRHAFLVPEGLQEPSMAQLGSLRASRREGNPLLPPGQTTPRCCPTGHKMSGNGRAQMEKNLCVCFNADFWI